MQMSTNLTSETEAPLRGAAPGARHGVPAGTVTAGQRAFPVSPFSMPTQLRIGGRW
jgi:hypothetical protein